MLECPRCHQKVASQAIACPYCRTPLKAYGHPGIPLYRGKAGEPLCPGCKYDADDSCTLPRRPFVTECTLYCDRQPAVSASSRDSVTFSTWINRHLGWLALAILLLISLVIALFQ